jgi:dihydropteroate synthase
VLAKAVIVRGIPQGAGLTPIRLMGVLNVTPDSFSDGGRHADPVAAGMEMAAQGADIIDVGGESTRPGASPVPPEEEQRRVLPVVSALAGAGLCVSVDTRNAGTMAAALDAGAAIVNDVSALQHDPGAAPVLARGTCTVILMHMRGTPQTMMQHAAYADVALEVRTELAQRIAYAEAAGIARARLVLDPGLGFAKTAEQSLELLRRLPELGTLGLPIVVGASRKAFIGAAGGEAVAARRVAGSIAAALFAVDRGAAILRVHDVPETRQALRVWQTLSGHGPYA